MKKPSLYEFLDYRLFLSAISAYLFEEKDLSKRGVSKILGFQSPNYLQILIERKRNLSPRMAKQVSRRLGFSMTETKFFLQLVQFNDCTNPNEKDRLFEGLLKSKSFLSSYRTAFEEYKFFSNWHIVALLEGIATPWRNFSPSRMAKDLGISPEEVKESLKILETLGLIHKVGASWKRRDAVLETPPETKSLNVRNFHRQMIAKAARSLDESDPESRSIAGLTMALSIEQIEKLKVKLNEFQTEINAEYSSEGDPDRIMQLNFQFFPLFNLK